MGLNVLSLFDGISCGQLALQRAGIEIDHYFASEIDKYAIKIAQKNFPNTVQLGDIQNWREWELPKIDLIIAGSPCQGFSNAGKGLNFDDPRSKLFFTFCDILAVYYGKNPDLKYLLENVKMKKKWQEIITDRMKVEPVLINSALVSAQSRNRLYWANWTFGQPEDRGIYLKDIIEDGEVDREKSYAIDANYFKGGSSDYLKRIYHGKAKRQAVKYQSARRLMVQVQGAAIRNQVTKRGVEEQLNIRKDGKSNCVVPSYPHKLNGVAIGRQVRRRINSEGKRDDYNQDIKPKQRIEVTRTDGKSGTIFTVQKDNLLIQDDFSYRKLTPLECERLQTLPEGYTEGISNTQRYKCIGNGWTIDVVAHIFSALKQELYTV